MTLPVPAPPRPRLFPRWPRLASGVVVFGIALVAPLPIADVEPSRRPASVLRQLGAVELESPDSSARVAQAEPHEVRPRRVYRRTVRLRTPPVVRPASGPVSSPFGWRQHPVSGRSRHHDGADLAVPLGSPVRAVASGVVRSLGRRSGYGLVVEIDHAMVTGSPHVRTLYAHLSSADWRLAPGVRVGRGQPIGASGGVPGQDGISTGPHLHFEVRDRLGRALDPAPFLGATSPRQRADEQRWQVMFSSGRKPLTAPSAHRSRQRARAAFALPQAAGSRGRTRRQR